MAKIIDGKAFAQSIRKNVAEQTKQFINQTGVTPGLAVVLVGEDPASQVYVRNKGKQATEVGFVSEEYLFAESVDEQTLLNKIEALNNADHIHGILVQLPLPSHINNDVVLNAIKPEKDIDGFHPVNVGRLWTGNPISVPCTPLGCSLILEEELGDLGGKHAVIVGRSNIVGKPMAALLLKMNATVTVAHSKTDNLPKIIGQADIVIAAVGKAKFIKGEWLKEGGVVLDVGINRVENDGMSKLVGDVDFEVAVDKVKAITPVPGGIGPMTIACLLKNTLACAKNLTTETSAN